MAKCTRDAAFETVGSRRLGSEWHYAKIAPSHTHTFAWGQSCLIYSLGWLSLEHRYTDEANKRVVIETS